MQKGSITSRFRFLGLVVACVCGMLFSSVKTSATEEKEKRFMDVNIPMQLKVQLKEESEPILLAVAEIIFEDLKENRIPLEEYGGFLDVKPPMALQKEVMDNFNWLVFLNRNAGYDALDVASKMFLFISEKNYDDSVFKNLNSVFIEVKNVTDGAIVFEKELSFFNGIENSSVLKEYFIKSFGDDGKLDEKKLSSFYKEIGDKYPKIAEAVIYDKDILNGSEDFHVGKKYEINFYTDSSKVEKIAASKNCNL